MDGGKTFIEIRDRLLRDGVGPEEGARLLVWPALEHFNWGQDYFDRIARGNEQCALRVVDDAGLDQRVSYQALAQRSDQVAGYLASLGLEPGDRLLIMLGNTVPLWETMLACIKLGAVIIPATTLLTRADLVDRLSRGRVKAVVADATHLSLFEGLEGAPIRIAVGAGAASSPHAAGWHRYEDSFGAMQDFRGPKTRANALLLLYFTSGTTARPKLVAHSHTSYPVGQDRKSVV